ncbi:MAG TPA: response regulator transcription factor, partial [Vicinamibacteria bacterium]|nr:response regulator transcription factor [Vicinamibacteria bacterium]
ADDHAIVRRGLKELLGEASDIEVAAEAASAQEALDCVRQQAFDVAVLDLGLPGRGGLELLAEIKAERPALPVLILTMQPEDQYAVRALRAGAAGYVTKESAPEVLVQAVRRVAAGGRYVSPTLAEKLAEIVEGGGERDPHEALSNREFQVFRRLGAGRTVSQIAEELSLSVKTVSTYRTRILEKMGLETNAELMRYAVRHQLVD